MRIEFISVNNKNPNTCHDFLIQNGVKPKVFENDLVEDEKGDLISNATYFAITVDDIDVEKTTDLVNQFIEQ